MFPDDSVSPIEGLQKEYDIHNQAEVNEPMLFNAVAFLFMVTVIVGLMIFAVIKAVFNV